jgi:cystathionine beta-lyase
MLNERPDTRHVVLMADDDQKAQLAMTELEGLIQAKQCLLQFLSGGLRAWQAENLPVEVTPDQPPNADCIDFLFFVHDRHSGNREAMRQYLAWETGLMAQVTEDDKKLFTLYEQVHGE